MKLLVVLLCLAGLCGCASVPKYIDQVKQVRDAINGMLPSDFKGDVDMQRHDSYFDLTLKASDLHKNKDGEWTWASIDYERDTHIATWSSRVTIKLGKQP
jgi:hypothetical protein